MTKNDIDDALQELHDSLIIPMLDAATDAYREETPDSLAEAVKTLHLSTVALQGIIASVEVTEALHTDQDVLWEVSRVARLIVDCQQDLEALVQGMTEEVQVSEAEKN
ncbi:hypothetical protein CJP72_13130 [Citrobacter sp. NCU1]|uniref:hypothetical protein n=1 Tax=Citrobacter sp. NCU1 TaxID=2026683 RepID=UPI001391A808|nr:hypothetical protein [Citrobacter sp. NCU1]NDO81671.1 hypothetical protein [Citrobacter sp. NCU1]